MHEMWTTAINDPNVCQSVCHTASLCKQGSMLAVQTLGDTRNLVPDGSPDLSHAFNAAFTKYLWPLVLTF